MTHASTANAPFAAPRNLIRLSVGIEAATDLVADLEAALVAHSGARPRLKTAGARADRPRVPRLPRARSACTSSRRPTAPRCSTAGRPPRSRGSARGFASAASSWPTSAISSSPTSISTTPAPRGRSSASTRSSRCGSPRSARRTSPTRRASRPRPAGSTARPSTRSGASSRPYRADRIRIAEGDVLGWEAFPTPGHASHHVCYLRDGTLFAGDACGVRIQPDPVRAAGLAAARHRRRGLARHDRRDRAPRARPPRPHPFRRRDRRRGAPRPPRLGARPLGRARRRRRRRSTPSSPRFASTAPMEALYDAAAPYRQSWQGLAATGLRSRAAAR